MPNGSLSALVEYIRQIARRGPASEITDSQLLERFIAQRDENAFSTLVQRHGPLVLTVCRRVLHNPQDVEDAFQATFLVLVRKAASIAKKESVSSWLHGVAFRTALRAKTHMARQGALESQVQRTPAPDCMQEVILQDLRLILDEEVQRLPERYRLPFVLCYMEGKTNEEAAVILGCPKGTILSRLSRAREKLRRRLTRRGLGLSAGLIATILSQSAVSAAVPPALADSTVKAALAFAGGAAAAGAISANVAALTDGVLKAMLLTKLKITVAVLIGFTLVGVGASAILSPVPADVASSPHAAESPKPAKQGGAPKTDAEALLGTWLVVSRGEKQGFDSITFTRERLHLHYGSKTTFRCQYALDPTKTPKAIDIHGAENGTGVNPDDPYQCIYKLNGTELELAFGTPTKRPASFAEAAKEGQRVVLKRARPEAAPKHQKSAKPDLKRVEAATPFENAFGFGWLSQPAEINLGTNTTSMTAVGGAGVAWIPEKKDGSLIVTLAHLGGDRQYRPVVYGADRTARYLPYASMSAGSDAGGTSLAMQRYILDAKILPPEKVKYIGIEFSTPEGRKAIAKLAIARAKADKIPILPYPELGEAFDFEFPTMDGKRINSRDLRGKVVLIEYWTVGCVPLMEKMPGLRKLYEKRKKDGFEVIGINFDISPESVTDAGEQRGLTWPKVAKESPWPQVHVPEDATIQELWQNAEHLGRLYLIDRQGILRADCHADELLASINTLLDAKKLKD